MNNDDALEVLDELGGDSEEDEEEMAMREREEEETKEEEKVIYFNDSVKEVLSHYRRNKDHVLQDKTKRTVESNLEDLFSQFNVKTQQRH